MSTQPIAHPTAEQYLEIERTSEFRSEYLNGEVFPISAATRNHVRILGNTFIGLSEQLREGPCEAAASDLRLFCAEYRVFMYPDLVVTCGPDKYFDNRRDTITDATLVVEILSPSTMNYDRGEKFRFYRSLPSFAEYLLLPQDAIRAEHHVRQSDSSWLFRELTDPSSHIELRSVGCRLKLESLYKRVEFEAAN